MPKDSHRGRILTLFGQYLRFPLWPWTVVALMTMVAGNAGLRPPIRFLSPNLTAMLTLHIMLVYFIIFTVSSAGRRDQARASGIAALVRAHKATVFAGLITVIIFVLMLSGEWFSRFPLLQYIELAAMMTSVPFAVAVAYRLYQFSFMDAFVREVLSGIILVTAFVLALTVTQSVAWMTACAIGLAFLKPPVTRWVERSLMGRSESVEEQEERIGTAIRALTRLDEFPARVSEILASELQAQWVEIDSNIKPGAVHRFEIPGSGLWLSLGPRLVARQYMSREVRIARAAALQLAAHHHQLTRHAMREVTARAQVRALQAQINPHFLFNTLNVLASLIHSDPPKAERVTEQLADIFRYALESTRVEWVTLDDELRFLESYLEIEKARFEERLLYALDVAPSIRSIKVPAMVLQPLVENAIKHGIAPNVRGGHVRVAGQIERDNLLIVVEDTGLGQRSSSRNSGTGVGLANVRERLQHIYGVAAGLKLEPISPAGMRVTLTLPQPVGVSS
jgi:signal transduction histidine kinase